MAILNQKKILNLVPKVSAPVTIHVSQGDIGTVIEFTLVKGDEVFSNTGDLSASVHGVREDGANFGPFTCTLNRSSVSFPLHSEMTVVKGSAIAEVVLVDDQGDKVGSANFGILVEESAFPLGVTYDNDVSVYESILAYVQTMPAQIMADVTAAVAQEAATRAAADATFNNALASTNSNLSSEISSRASADSLINTRIDEIIAPSGEAPSAAEVQDARVGVDSTIYSALGDAVRGQITNTKTALANNVTDINAELYDFSSVEPSFVIGQVNPSTGGNQAVVYGIRTEYVNAGAGDIIYLKVKEGAKAQIFFYNGSTYLPMEDYIELAGGNSRAYIAPANTTRYRIRLYRVYDKENSINVSDSISQVAQNISIFKAQRKIARKSDINITYPIPSYVQPWAANTAYELGEQIYYDGNAYICFESHTSGETFDTEKWVEMLFDTDLNSISQMNVSNTSYKIPQSILKIDKITWAEAGVPDVGMVAYLAKYNAIAIRRGNGGLSNYFRLVPVYPGALFNLHGNEYTWENNKLVSTDSSRELISDKPKVKYSNKYINASGRITDTSSDTFITETIELNAGDVLMVSGYVSNNMTVISETDLEQSFYKPLKAGTGNHYEEYIYEASKHEYVCICLYNNYEYLYYLNKKKDAVIDVDLNWVMPGTVSLDGMLSPSTLASTFNISNPIRVYRGDIIKGHLYAGPFAILCDSLDRINTYQGNTYKVLYSTGSAGSTDFEYTSLKDGYVLVTAKTSELPSGYKNTLSITRSADSNDEVSARDESPKRYVDKYDFIPDLTEKRINNIMCYSGDNKKQSNFMVNAVAYPNGEIIACRAGGNVVKVANDGTETVLLTVDNSQDWRGMFMDKNLNVFVSPHSSTFSPSISRTDRGLYRLAYGANSFEKVIELCRSTTDILEWAKNTSYSVGDIVFRDDRKEFIVKCIEAHTSGTSYDATYWEDAPEWAKNTPYSVGDVVKYNDLYFYCKDAHTSGNTFNYTKWDAATEHMNNDDTIWTMCEDNFGNLYAGVYAHSKRANPSVYKSTDGGITWIYITNFLTTNVLPDSRHVHCINFNNYDNCLYGAIGERNTIVKSEDYGNTWKDLNVSCYYGQPTYVLGVKDGVLIGSDGHYSCGVSKLMLNGEVKLCGRTAPGFIFNIRRSDLTGWLYAFTRIDNYVQNTATCPPVEAISDPAVLEAWKNDPNTDATALAFWTDYNAWASKYYPEDAIRPQNAVMMVSRDEGETWEVFHKEKVSMNYASICGFITVGYFRDGELLVGFLQGIEGTEDGKAFVQPVIVSEGKKKRTAEGFDLTGEIFIKTNETNIIPY